MITKKDIETNTQSHIEQRNLLLKTIDHDTIHKAWFIISHLILHEGAKVVDMGCHDGAITYTMAALEPELNFIGIDKDKKHINRAKEKYQLHNLEYIYKDASKEIFEPESLDAIVNSYILHEIYSGSRYNEKIVSDTLRTHFKMLKKGGVMFIHDYSRPTLGEFIMMEMPDEPSTGNSLSELSEADLLIWYSEHAQPRQDPGCGGFFLEELPSRFPKNRLFYLPYKWAYEFIMRKDDRSLWEKELPMEYTFFTTHEFRKELRALGARVHYSSLHWDENIIEQRFENHFKLFDANGQPLGYPPTSYITVAYKMAERKSLHIEERRPSHTEENNLKITAVRNQKTGEIQDIVSTGIQISEIIPYRINEENRLKIYLHDGIARSITNAVPRSGMNIDGRRWSGHMIESIAVDSEAMETVKEFDVKHSVRFARDYLGLKPTESSILEHGSNYYPSPDYIDERIHTYYLEVKESKSDMNPKSLIGQTRGFQAKGKIREMDAQQVLNAIAVGMIPNARLELQILALFQHLKIPPENWLQKQITFKTGKIKQKTNLKDIMDSCRTEDTRFKDIKGTAGQLRPVHSIFVEQGQSRGAMTGLSAQNIDFIIRDDQTINTAVVLPLTEDLQQDVHAGFILKQLPVPERHKENGITIAAPSFNLPREIKDIETAKKYIAEKYGVLPSMVIKLGESYFSHIGVTPQKIHPFAVVVPPNKPLDPETQFLPFYQFMLLYSSLAKDPHLMLVIARAYQFFHEELCFDFKQRVQAVMKDRFDNMQQDWSLPLSFAPSPFEKKTKHNVKKKPTLDGINKEELSKLITSANSLKVKSPVSQNPKEEIETKDKPDSLSKPALKGSFEVELREFMDTLEKQTEQKPQPEKW